MPWIVMKNNLKLMMRSKWIIAALIIVPIITISVLSSAFKSLMESYDDNKKITVEYEISKDSVFETSINTMKDAAKEQKLYFEESNGNADVRVIFQGKEYTIEHTAKGKKDAVKVQYFLNQFVLKMEQSIQKGNKHINIPVHKVTINPTIESKDYYGIIYVIYFIWIAYVALMPVVTSERKNHFSKRFGVAPISKFGFYMAKLLPCTLLTAIETIISGVIATKLFHIKWGNIPATIGILALTVVAATAVGIFFMYLFRNLAVAGAVQFTLLWVVGMFGGTYETYMFSIYPEFVKKCSVLYHINRTLTEYSTTGTSSYTVSCVLYLCAVIAVSILGSMLMMRCRKESV